MDTTINFTSDTLVVLAGSVGIICIQIILSKRENRWLGLIMPFISFCFSIIMIFVVALLDMVSIWQTVFVAMISCFLVNIPTIILMAIYLGCRERMKRKIDLNKWNDHLTDWET